MKNSTVNLVDMNEQEVFEQFCIAVKEGSSIDARSKLMSLFGLISIEEFLIKYPKYNYIELTQIFNVKKKDSWPRYDDLILGFLYLNVNNGNNAYRHLSNAIQKEPDHYLAYYLRSFIDIEINSKCIDDAKEATILNPNERTLFSLGNRYFENGKRKQNATSPAFSRAILSFRNSLKLNNDYVFSRLQLARVFYSTYNYYMAYKEFKRCIEIKPEEGIFYLEISRTLSKMTWSSKVSKREEKAFIYLNKGLKLDEENPLFHLELGNLYGKIDDLEQSILHYEKYLEKSGFEIEDHNISLRENSKEEPIEIKKRSNNVMLNWEYSLSSIKPDPLSEPKIISTKLKMFKRMKLIRDGNTLLEEKKYVKAINVYENLIKKYLNLNVYIDYNVLKEYSKYYKCKILSKNKNFQFDYEHPKYKWLDSDRDASSYRRSIYEIYSEAKIMEIVKSFQETETKLSFGKYKDVDLKTVIEKDLSYIKWCYFNIPSFFIIDLIRVDEKLRKLNDYYKLIEIHLIKADYLFQVFDDEEEDYHREYPSLGDVLGRGEAGLAYWNTH